MGKLEKGFAIGAVLAAVAVGGVLYSIYPNLFTPNYARQTVGQSTMGQTTTAAQNTSTAQTNGTSTNSTSTSSQNSTGIGQSTASVTQSSSSGY